MLPYFPTAYQDELIYSLVARYHRHCCSKSPKATLQELFGCRNVRATVDLPGHIGALADRLPPSLRLSANYLIQNHTLLPYYVAFQTPEVTKAALEAMTTRTTKGLHLRLGLGSSKLTRPVGLRYCLRCQQADSFHGERYWSRSLQLPGVLVCPKHGTPLYSVNLDSQAVGQHEFLAAEGVDVPDKQAPTWSSDHSRMALLHHIARESIWYLSQPLFHERMVGRSVFVDRCASCGLIRSKKQVDLVELEKLHVLALSPLKGLLPEAESSDWLATLLRSPRKAIMPLHVILFGVVLDQCQKFSIVKLRPQPRHFLKDDSEFSTALRAAIDSGLGLRATARKLGVDANTVRRHSIRLNIPCNWKALEKVQRTSRDDKPRAHETWLVAMTDHPDAGRTELRRIAPAAFSWLYRNDREWLDQHSPPPAQRPPPKARVDWDVADIEIRAQIRSAATELYAATPPLRITLASLERHIGRPRWISDRKAKLPLTMALVAETLETVTRFQLRRLAWAKAKQEKNGQAAPEWKLLRLSGLRAAPLHPKH